MPNDLSAIPVAMNDPSPTTPVPRRSSADAKPFCAATLAEHRRLAIDLRRNGGPFEDEVLGFLGLTDREVVLLSGNYPIYELPQIARAVQSCFADWTTVFEGGPDCYGGHLWSPKYRRFEVRPNRWKSLLVSGTRFCTLPDGSRRVWLFEADDLRKPTSVEVTLLAPRVERRRAMQDIRRLRKAMAGRHYLCGQAIDADGCLLSDKHRAEWSDLVVSPKAADVLRRQVVDFLKLRDVFRRNGVPQKRGVLLYGPPGNGKTTVGRVLAGMSGVTFLYVTAADVAANGCPVRRIFRLARKLRPSILFLEDLDFYASERSTVRNEAALGELLAQMDGMQRNDGVVVIATTNDPTAIEPALKDRPSRFDVLLELPAPSAESRLQMLRRFFGRTHVDDSLLLQAAGSADGFSGAQLRELSVAAIQHAILRGAVDDDGAAHPNLVDIDEALTQVAGGRQRRKLGFHAASNA